jgi:hypothetical protein
MEPFCYWQFEKNGNDRKFCSAHLPESSSECSFKPEEIRYGNVSVGDSKLYISHTGRPDIGACQDFKLVEGTDEKSLIRKIVEQNQLTVR